MTKLFLRTSKINSHGDYNQKLVRENNFITSKEIFIFINLVQKNGIKNTFQTFSSLPLTFETLSNSIFSWLEYRIIFLPKKNGKIHSTHMKAINMQLSFKIYMTIAKEG